MKKRALSFLLCVLMVLPLMLASCTLGGNDPSNTTTSNGEEDIYVKPATLNFHIIADKAVSAEDEVAIEEAFNTISKKLYKTQIDLVFYTADEYDTKLMENLQAAAAIGGASAADKFEKSEVVTSLNDVNIPIETYPEIENNQVDIILINSKELYQSLRKKGYLAEISEELDTKFTDIEQRVNSHLINGAKEGKSMFAIPNNVLIGRYEFVLVHEALAYQTAYKQKEDFLTGKGTQKVIDYSALRKFAEELQQIKNEKDATTGEYVGLYNDMRKTLGVNEIYTLEKTFDYPTVTYFAKEESKNTIFGVVYPFNATLGSSVKLDNVFNDTNFLEHKKLMLEAATYGYCPETAPAGSAAYAIRYATGNFVDIAKFEKAGYIVLQADTPRLNSDDAFNAMFAVTNYSASTDRALEIVQALVAGTDEDEVELRNILQYGKEDFHYVKDDDTNRIVRKNQNYLMDANYTGNLVTAYPCEEDGRDDAFLGYFTEQNKDATLNPLHGITAEALWEKAHTSMIDYYLCKKMAAAMVEEFNDAERYPDSVINTLMADTAEVGDTAETKRAKLVNGVKNVEVKYFYPATEFMTAYKALYQYWLDVRAGINPLAEKTDATPSAPSDVKKALDSQITALESEAKTKATEYAQLAADTAETVCSRIAALDNVEKLEEFLEALKVIKTGKTETGTALTNDALTIKGVEFNDALTIYEVLFRNKNDAEKAGADFFGMLYSGGSSSLVYPSTLTDALAAWYYDYVNGR